MLGRRQPQHSLFEAHAWPQRVPEDSFYARMGAVNDALFKDDDLAGMYCENNGRPSVPPSLMSGIVLLQFYDDVRDEEAIARVNYRAASGEASGGVLREKLEQLRAESGLSYQHLSEHSYVDVAYLHRLETGRAVRPSRDVLIRIGTGLGLDMQAIDELIIMAGHWPLLHEPEKTDRLPREKDASPKRLAVATN